MHLDNSKVHNSIMSMKKYDELGFKRPPHPAYSPDVAPSDFYLFGYLEQKLQGKQFNDIEGLEEELHEILGIGRTKSPFPKLFSMNNKNYLKMIIYL